MKMSAVAVLSIALLGASACSKANVVRSTEGVLTLVDEYPGTIDAASSDGTLVARNGCIAFERADGATFQPIFPKGATLRSLQRQFGSLAQPRMVTISGFDASGSLPLAVAESAEAKRCPGAPFVFGSIDLPSSRLPPG